MNETPYFMGIDPGATGAAAIVSAHAALTFPFKGESIARVIALADSHWEGKAWCVLEKVNAFPGQGVASSFAFGRAYGAALGALELLAIPHILITPAKWTKEFTPQSGKRTKAEKKRSLQDAARRLWPDLTITADTADALLLAEYARRYFSS